LSTKKSKILNQNIKFQNNFLPKTTCDMIDHEKRKVFAFEDTSAFLKLVDKALDMKEWSTRALSLPRDDVKRYLF